MMAQCVNTLWPSIRRLAAPGAMARVTLATLVFAVFASAVDAKLLSMIPANSEGVGGADVRAIMSSGLVREFMNSPGANPAELLEVMAATGLDFRNDIHEVVFAAYTAPAPKDGAKPAAAMGLGLITGRFDPARIGALIVSKGGTQSTYKGYTLYTPTASKNKDGDVTAFLDGATMLAGNPAYVKQVLDKAQGGLSPDVLARVNAVSSRYDLWMVSTASPAKMANDLTGGTPGAEGAAFGAEFLKKIESTQGGIKLGPTISIGMEVISTTPEDATALMNVLGFFRSMIGSQPPKEGQAGPPQAFVNMLNAIQMRTDSKTLVISMDVPEADVISFLRESQKKGAEAKAAKPNAPVEEEIKIIQ